jgi:hypothetical protein
VIDPKAGAYCNITLDSGEKIVVRVKCAALLANR